MTWLLLTQRVNPRFPRLTYAATADTLREAIYHIKLEHSVTLNQTAGAQRSVKPESEIFQEVLLPVFVGCEF